MKSNQTPVALTRSLTLAVAGLGIAASSQAQLTHYVPFDVGYTAGADLHMSGGSDLGFGTNTWFDGSAAGLGSAVESGNLTGPGNLATSGNSVRTALTDFNLGFYTFDADNDGMNGEPEDSLQPGEHWMSFVARTDAVSDFAGVSLVKFFGGEILYIGKIGGSAINGGLGEWGFDQGATGPTSAPGSDSTQDTLLVVKLTIGPEANDDFADLYINPTPGGAVPATPDIAGYAFDEGQAGGRAIDEIRLGSQASPLYADEIRIGATFADVTPAAGGGLSADFNTDGIVDLLDLDILGGNWQMVGTASTGDANGDGTVDLLDLDLLGAQWQQSGSFAEALAASGIAVPEPASAALLAMGALALTRRRR